ncbi:hypothetical protein JCM11641_006868 [Rhodosporidiobolus odoratus]
MTILFCRLLTEEASSSFERVLRSELFESPFKRSRQNSADSTRSPFTNATNVPSGSPARLRSTSQPSTLFSFSSPARKTPLSRAQAGTILQDQAFNASPLSVETQNELSRPKSASRVVEQLPYAVLDAPYIQDDYYTQPLAWSSSQNILAVALGSSVYTWKPGKKQGEPREVACIRNYGYLGRNVVTSIRWVSDDTISVGTSKGFIDFVDVTRQQLVRRLSCHEARIGALDLSPSRILTSGSADKTIKHHDSRMPYSVASEVKVHKGQVCGLKWSSNGELASGGNDDKLFIMKGVATVCQSSFTLSTSDPTLLIMPTLQKPLYSLSHVHNAAVKALDWSPHQPHLLCSGGGARDGTIRFWSSRTGEEALDKVDIGSQICQVIWSRNSDEIVSSHGFGWNSPENRLFVWKINSSAPTTQCVASLSGHSYRVLHLALSPDGKSVVSGSGDETLRLWKVFPRVPKTQYKPRRSSLDPTSLIR